MLAWWLPPHCRCPPAPTAGTVLLGDPGSAGLAGGASAVGSPRHRRPGLRASAGNIPQGPRRPKVP